MKKHTEDCLDANDDTSVLKGKCICPTPQHTPTPESIDMPMSIKTSGRLVTIPEELYLALKGKNPAFIVRAVNCHEELLEAAKNAGNVLAALINGDLSTLKIDSHALALLRQAIAKAEGK